MDYANMEYAINKSKENPLLKKKLDSYTHSQIKQLYFIDFSLFFKGHLNTSSLQERFSLTPADALASFQHYLDCAPENIDLDELNQRYFQSNSFKPLFAYDVRRTLTKITNGISDGFDAIEAQPYPIQAPSLLNTPDLTVVARLSQAIMNGNAVNVIYTSLSSGSSARDLVPHSIVDNGLRWHLRAFDRKSQTFRDFVLTRISKVSLLSNDNDIRETKRYDEEWNSPIKLKIVAHPKNVQFATAIEIDYGMIDGVLEINTNAALAGYLLRRWNVDCSVDAHLTGGEFQLWLKNRNEIKQVQNLAIAPGY
ncbi:WYL domain-containing protein [Psychrosphaera ytuae]|nr:WYL domain-containing protein [Psychrosphaera ytuae]